MVQENEIVMLILGIGVFLLTLKIRDNIKRIPHWRLIITGFYFLFIAWIMTVAEGLIWGDILNFLEHFCYFGSGTALAAWCWKMNFLEKKTT